MTDPMRLDMVIVFVPGGRGDMAAMGEAWTRPAVAEPTAPQWRTITCAERDAIMDSNNGQIRIGTHLVERFGAPHIHTEWVDLDDRPVLRDDRWPQRDGNSPDARPCVHQVRS